MKEHKGFFNREQRKTRWQPPLVLEGETISGVLGILQDPPMDSESTTRNGAERDQRRASSVSLNSRIKRKFDTMMDMMSQLLGKFS